MSSVHYKFKATLEYKTLTFDGLHIGVDELKKAICDKENIRTESFDLLLMNAHTKREYAAGELVPRNSSVVVQRIPRDNALKLPKVHDTSTSGIVSRGPTGSFQQSQSSYISPDEFSKLSEEQRIAHIKQVSTEKYSAANYQRRPSGIMTGPPPPTYVCNRCAQPGHWYKNCPLVNTRRTTGIPMDELMETSRDDPLAMLHPSGKFVKPIMHYQARMQRKYEPFPGQPDDTGGSPYADGDEQVAVPEQYKCVLCKGLLRDAVLAACCGHSFCAECYQQQLLNHPSERCPGPECTQQISADSLVPNKSLRSAIQKYLNELRPGIEAASADQTSTGANKPSVLNDTSSLLHKLLPDLAYAQAKRELATAGRSPVDSGKRTATPPLKSTAPTSILQATINNTLPSLFSTFAPTTMHIQKTTTAAVTTTMTSFPGVVFTSTPFMPDLSTPPPPIPHPQAPNLQTTTQGSDITEAWQAFLRMKDNKQQQHQNGGTKTYKKRIPDMATGRRSRSPLGPGTRITAPPLKSSTLVASSSPPPFQPSAPGTILKVTPKSPSAHQQSKNTEQSNDFDGAWKALLRITDNKHQDDDIKTYKKEAKDVSKRSRSPFGSGKRVKASPQKSKEDKLSEKDEEIKEEEPNKKKKNYHRKEEKDVSKRSRSPLLGSGTTPPLKPREKEDKPHEEDEEMKEEMKKKKRHHKKEAENGSRRSRSPLLSSSRTTPPLKPSEKEDKLSEKDEEMKEETDEKKKRHHKKETKTISRRSRSPPDSGTTSVLKSREDKLHEKDDEEVKEGTHKRKRSHHKKESEDDSRSRRSRSPLGSVTIASSLKPIEKEDKLPEKDEEMKEEPKKKKKRHHKKEAKEKKRSKEEKKKKKDREKEERRRHKAGKEKKHRKEKKKTKEPEEKRGKRKRSRRETTDDD